MSICEWLLIIIDEDAEDNKMKGKTLAYFLSTPSVNLFRLVIAPFSLSPSFRNRHLSGVSLFVCPRRIMFSAPEPSHKATSTGLHRFMREKKATDNGSHSEYVGWKSVGSMICLQSTGWTTENGIQSNWKDVLSLLIVQGELCNISSGGGWIVTSTNTVNWKENVKFERGIWALPLSGTGLFKKADVYLRAVNKYKWCCAVWFQYNTLKLTIIVSTAFLSGLSPRLTVVADLE